MWQPLKTYLNNPLFDLVSHTANDKRGFLFYNMKKTRRKGFNFYRSYYDVFNELSDKDKLEFIKALLDKQFLDVDPKDLKGMAKFAWISQVNSIDEQVKGYKSKTNDPMQGSLEPLSKGGEQGGRITPKLQEEEKEKVKGKEEDKYPSDFLEFKNYAIEKSKGKNINLDLTKLELKYESWKEAGWINGNGKKIINWKSTLLNTIKYLEKDKEKSSAKKEREKLNWEDLQIASKNLEQ